MKFFTAELIARLGSLDDDIADAADAEWEEAIDRHEQQVQAIHPHLPAGLGALLDTYYLHDARILSMGLQGETFVIVLRLDVPPHEVLILSYQLTEEPRINPQALPQESESPAALWLYDELGWSDGDPGHATHSILLSNGWEIELHVRDLQVSALKTLYPVVPAPAATAATVPA